MLILLGREKYPFKWEWPKYRWVYTFVYVETGFVQSLGFWKKSWNLPSNFPDLKKVWKIKMKSGKMVQILDFFFSKLRQVLYTWFFFRFGRILFNLARTFAVRHGKKLCPCFFEVPINHLFDNLESGNRNYSFGKSLEKVLHFGFKNLYEPWKSTGHSD